ncbi:hypothetical protein TVAGG3_0970650 [Trichomonas vaginalis G3]|uniref:hypothetical protein n=1 Tax=Trichomonas vaginalis (strain ATCC PRA-98 / G3) TaxID=412133 RepID=UPI0021E53C36|nr:hypothetical protein TVAGG3_0970640 [Trichomonas vaginalis G3]XP_051079239.1 hypothetical protein TVAGG3_0970650 [Trichomonas vaginalis G3]KAI5488564.1 hypothetical protein TVAGG3_0970640 [Trichomonas vaginalis G3]KAI5488565.1 hypothetical protein TVAGG3_0970650 [Trichomonas vaginalis G3]
MSETTTSNITEEVNDNADENITEGASENIDEFVDEISDEAVEITAYGKHSFEFYYYVENEDAFYYYTGLNYRKLHINFTKTGAAYVCMIDTENKRVILCINKFKRLYGFM